MTSLSEIGELETEIRFVEKQCRNIMDKGGSFCVSKKNQLMNIYLYALKQSLERKRNAP